MKTCKFFFLQQAFPRGKEGEQKLGQGKIVVDPGEGKIPPFKVDPEPGSVVPGKKVHLSNDIMGIWASGRD